VKQPFLWAESRNFRGQILSRLPNNSIEALNLEITGEEGLCELLQPTG